MLFRSPEQSKINCSPHLQYHDLQFDERRCLLKACFHLSVFFFSSGIWVLGVAFVVLNRLAVCVDLVAFYICNFGVIFEVWRSWYWRWGLQLILLCSGDCFLRVILSEDLWQAQEGDEMRTRLAGVHKFRNRVRQACSCPNCCSSAAGILCTL